MKELQVGDVIYSDHYGALNRLVIDRVTPKRAYVGYSEFKRQVSDTGYVYPLKRDPWSSKSHWIETDELKERFNFRTAQRRLFADWDKLKEKLNIEQIRSIQGILDSYKTNL